MLIVTFQPVNLSQHNVMLSIEIWLFWLCWVLSYCGTLSIVVLSVTMLSAFITSVGGISCIFLCGWRSLSGRHDNQHNDTQDNYIQHNNKWHSAQMTPSISGWTQHSRTLPSIVLLSVLFNLLLCWMLSSWKSQCWMSLCWILWYT
jgi:hypothetical protein